MVVLERPAIPTEPLSENARTTFGSASAPAWCLRLLRDATAYPRHCPCRAWLERRLGGRKLWLRGTVEYGECGLFAEAEGLRRWENRCPGCEAM
ncbi:hypothetical protein X797_006775 [Metarhizium robertsii]|uniref:Uncharacterized protein n=1 Tax=Metarhizium robertsii TaxID=568076 RepID=A0A014NDR7_9HYPO|nr:hypothetical protein X797_006775 [Metarhizium robertsii]